MTGITRRKFIQQSGKATAALAVGKVIFPASAKARPIGANDRINIALMGCGGRGRYDARGMVEAGANLTHICDLQPSRLEQARDFLSDVVQKKPAMIKDFREIIDSPEVDAIIIATPTHWHALPTILACQAGKDVYVEKPICNNIWESLKMVEAAAKYDRIVQVGIQNRSAPYNMEALDYIRSGKLGKIHLVKVYNLQPGSPFNMGPAEAPPDGFDWNEWLGRAPNRPYHQDILRSGWKNFWDYSGGFMTDDAYHQLDLALMLMGDVGIPKSVRSLGGRFAHRGDDSEVPDVAIYNWEFESFVMTLEHSTYPKYMRKTEATIRRKDALPYWTHNATRIELYGSDLMMTVGRHGGGWIVQEEGGGLVEKHFGRVPDVPHYQNFLDCVKSRKQPNATASIADVTYNIFEMANIAHRVGNTVLHYDPASRRFDNADADALLKSTYRPGYEIPDQV